MADTIKYQISPTKIDASNNENPLDTISIQSTYTKHYDITLTIATGASNTALPVIASPNTIEFIADQDLTFDIYTAAGVLESSLSACRYLLIKSTANKIYKMSNASGLTANVTWRLYVT